MTAKKLSQILRDQGNAEIAEHSQRFFKTGKGEYGEGDLFLGIRVPVLRSHAKAHCSMPLTEVQKLLKSKFHEERLCALLILVYQFEKTDSSGQKAIYDLYLKNMAYINNWDLVDCSSHPIVGRYLYSRSPEPLYQLARSSILWERRIAIISTYYFLKQKRLDVTLDIAELLMGDDEDLIHKAVGWMLRDLGKRNVRLAKVFLNKHYQKMPRTMLRYAIEKFPQAERKKYLAGLI